MKGHRLSQGLVLWLVIAVAWPVAAGAQGSWDASPSRVLDFTANSGLDYRMDAPSLAQRRDVYVYTPPGFDENADTQYPLLIWLHGAMGDERDFLRTVVPQLDYAIRSGRCPPLIAIAPDGSLEGDFPGGDIRRGGTASWFVNSPRGRFADYIVNDVYDWVMSRFPIRPEREAHAVAGWSMGGFSAYNLALKNRDKFGIVAGISPPLNMRYVDLNNFYHADFQAGQWGLRTSFSDPDEVMGVFRFGRRVLGIIPVERDVAVTAEMWFGPVWGLGSEGADFVGQENPVELIGSTSLRPDELHMYVAYSRTDQLNIDAQVESFVWLCRESGLAITAVASTGGGHDDAFLQSALPGTFDWLGSRLSR